MKFTDSEVANGTKAAVHGALLMIIAGCAVYNFSAWLDRRELHLAVNTAVYVSLVGFELHHVVHHCSKEVA